MSPIRRALAVALVPVVLLALALLQRDSRDGRSSPVTAGAADSGATLLPVAAPAGAVASTFYCAGGVADAKDPLATTIVVANPTGQPRSGRITTFPGALLGSAEQAAAVAKLKPVTRDLQVPAYARTEVKLPAVQPSPYAAALVEVEGGEIAVERRTEGSLGWAASPCASSPSTSWYFAAGGTTKDGRELLAIFNPFPDAAVADVGFVTSDGFRAPPDVQGLPVAAGQLVVVDAGTSAGRHEGVAANVVTRSGRVVVDRLQGYDGSDRTRPKGGSSTLGAPSLGTAWAFAEGFVSDTVQETYVVSNPSSTPAAVELDIQLDDPGTNGQVDPVTLDVPGRGLVAVSMAQQTRVPPGVAHSVTVKSTNGTPIVAERVLQGLPGGARQGWSATIGAPVTASRWLFAEGRADATVTEFLTIANPSASTARLQITALAAGQALPIDGLQAVEVPPSGRVAIELGAKINRADLPLLVVADQPVVVERGLFAASGTGLSLSTGVALAGQLSPIP